VVLVIILLRSSFKMLYPFLFLSFLIILLTLTMVRFDKAAGLAWLVLLTGTSHLVSHSFIM